MKEKTSQFWFVATVVLAAMYLISNPAMTSKVGSQLSEFWQAVISRVKAPELLANTEQTEQHPLTEPNMVVRRILDEATQQQSDPEVKAVLQLQEKVGEEHLNKEGNDGKSN